MTVLRNRINSSSSVSEESLSSECKIVVSFFNDSISIITSELLGKPLIGQKNESISVTDDLLLTDADKKLFVKALKKPPDFNENFVKAYHKYHGSKKNRVKNKRS